ncbi:MAG: ABC-F family ATP-binding cassette domain-containing protein, partial [Thermotogota bacterium]
MTFSVSKGECVALTGPNGSGKSTVLKTIIGEYPVERGQILLEEGTSIGYLQQNDVNSDEKVRYYLFKEFEHLKDAYQKIVERAEVSDMEYAGLLDDFIHFGGYEIEAAIYRELSSFSFTEDIMDKRINELSLGQRKIMEITSILIAQPDLFIMDEPTNHLDISMRIMLESIIREKTENGKTFLVVSHDRTFLDRVATKTIYIKRGISEQTEGGYSHMLELLNMKFQSAKKESEAIQRKIGELESLVTRKKGWADKAEKEKSGRGKKIIGRYSTDKGFLGAKAKKIAKSAKAYAAQKNRLIEDLKDKKPFVEKPVKLNIPDYIVETRKFIDCVACHFGYTPEDILLEDINMQITTRDKIALIGPNGSGKTTFFKLITGELNPLSGSIYRNEHINYTFIRQNIATVFEEEILFDNFHDVDEGHQMVHAALKASRLKEETLQKKVNQLSRGELVKAALVKAILSRSEFLLMDEPTNHLDVETLEVFQK